MSLPYPPQRTGDDHADLDRLYRYIYEFMLNFDNSAGSAIDPSVGQHGAAALTIVDIPGDITYTPGSQISVDGNIFGFIDVTFTKPDRTVDVIVFYREEGDDQYKQSYASESPFRLKPLVVGNDYEIFLAGQAANGSLGPFSPVTIVVIPTESMDVGVVVDLTLTGTYQSIVLDWLPPISGGVTLEYQVERADDEDFTINVVNWFADVTKFVDDVGLIDVERWYRVRAVDRAGSPGPYTVPQSATTLNVPDDSIITSKILDSNVTLPKIEDITGQRVLGAIINGPVVELTLSQVLDFIGSAAQGDILYRGALAWARLPAGTSGNFLKTQGAAANPIWDTASGSFSVLDTATIDITYAATVLSADVKVDSITYALIQNVSATARILARKTAGAGDVEEATLSEILDFIGSAAQGDILYRGASAWARLAAGTSGQFLKTQGAGANPVWDAAAGSFTVLDTATIDLTYAATVLSADVKVDSITYALIQNVSATARILARVTAGAGDVEEATLSQVLDFIGSAAQGDILYRGSSAWARLPAGTAGYVLETGGAGANPSWVPQTGGGGSTQGKHTIWIPSEAMTPATTFGAPSGQIETTSNKNNYADSLFPDGTDTYYKHFKMQFPKAWNLSTITYQVWWTVNSTSTNSIVWQLQAVALSDGDPLDVAYGTPIAISDAGLGTARLQHISAESSALTIDGTPAVSDMIAFRLLRDPQHASDNLAATGELLGINIYYTTDADTDA